MAAAKPGAEPEVLHRSFGHYEDMEEVPIADEMIRLGQFLKLAGLVDSGADAKVAVASGLVRVNGQPEDRRGRQLHQGDIVAYAGAEAVVTSAGP